jgi:hypothetical protein
MAREDEQRLKDLLRNIETGDIPEDLPDPEEYDDMGGIKSLDRGAPSIKMASETPEEEFELEIFMMLQEFEDAKKNGYGGSLEDFSKEYFTKKEMMKNRQMAMYGGRMQLANGPKEYGLYEDVIPKRYPDPITARIETEKEEAAMKREQASIADKKGKPKSKPFKMDEEKIKKLIEQRKKEQEKLAKGGIAGVL